LKPNLLFPLPLTSFEYYYWCDNRPEYPTTYPVDLHFSGRCDRLRLEQALAQTLRRHPLLTARIETDARGVPQWVAGDDQPPRIDWAPDKTPLGHTAEAMIDLTCEPGLRLWVREGAGCTRLTMQFHHACCDGQAAVRFAEELLGAYDHLCGGRVQPESAWPVEPLRLRRRGDYGPPPQGFWPLAQTYAIGARLWGKLLWQTPTPLAVPASGPCGTSQEYLGYASRVLQPELVGRLRAAAGNAGCTFNDLLLRDAFLAVQQWNVAHGATRNGWMRINVPTTLRDREDKHMPATNRLGFAFLTRNPRQCADPAYLLLDIHREMEAIRRDRLGLYFLGGLEMGRRLRGMIPRMLHSPRCFATIVLSYLGQLFPRSPLAGPDGRLRCGDLVLETVAGVPPIRPLTHAALAVLRYAGRTSLHLHCDPHAFSQEQAHGLLDHYLSQLQRSV
jgi:hypothetical protein